MNSGIQVFLDACENYTLSHVAGFLDKSSEVFPSISSLAGAKILLKPNLISSRGNLCSCTHPSFIAGVATWLLDHGARVYVGDSPAFGSAVSVLKKLGLDKVLSDLGVRIIEFQTKHRVTLAGGVKLVLAAEIFEYDLLVNLPKIKAHDQLFMTMAVKNFFGVVKGLHKAKLHMSHGRSVDEFGNILLDLLSLLPPNVSIADGVEVMHRHGPLKGESLMLGVMAASINPVALDTALLALLELDPGKSPLHLLAYGRNMPGARLSDLSFPILHPGSFHGSGFTAPDHLNPIRFHPFRFFSSSIKRAVLKTPFLA